MNDECDERRSGAIQLTVDDVREILDLIDCSDGREFHLGYRGFYLSVRLAVLDEEIER